MKHITLLLCVYLYLGLPTLAGAQQVVELSQAGQNRFEADFAAGGHLRLDLRSGEILISGTDDNKISVHFDGEDAEKFDNVKVSFKNSNGTGSLSVTGGPRNHFRIILEVPRTLDLHVRVPFGETEIAGITGNKDVEMHAGDLTISVGSDSD